MPELIEVEFYRLDLEALIGRTVTSVEVYDDRCVRPRGAPAEGLSALVGLKLVSTERHGKLLLANFGGVDVEETLGIRFGMTGRLLVDGKSRIHQLEYSSPKNDPLWDRFVVDFGGRRLSLRDQRLLGSIELNPDRTLLVPEASRISGADLERCLKGRTKKIKAVLLDQQILAGLGNLLADEVLWAAEISPHRSADSFSRREIETLARTIVDTVRRLTESGGSNTGESFEVRVAGASCPRCGGQMARDTIGGRTSWWCVQHQR